MSGPQGLIEVRDNHRFDEPALHRYLRYRLPDYDYDAHFGGALYLFLRGMDPDHPEGSGVHFDRPPAAFVEALSEALS